MAKIIGPARATRASQTIYDPTCGSSSLLLKADDEAPVELTLSRAGDGQRHGRARRR